MSILLILYLFMLEIKFKGFEFSRVFWEMLYLINYVLISACLFYFIFILFFVISYGDVTLTIISSYQTIFHSKHTMKYSNQYAQSRCKIVNVHVYFILIYHENMTS